MARINVNHPDTRVDLPTITFRGRLVTEGVYASLATTTVTNEIEEVTGRSAGGWRNQEPMVFYDDITVTITPDSDFSARSYDARTSGQFIGATANQNVAR